MLVHTFGSALYGIDALPISVEVSVSTGKDYTIVGLPDAVVKESLARIELAIKSIKMMMPRTKILINLAPADIKKTGAAFDLPIAVAILAASGQLNNPERLKDFMMMGELGLDGAIRPIKGVLSMAICALEKQKQGFVCPRQNVQEAAIIKGLKVYGARTLKEVVDLFNDIDQTSPEPVPDARGIFFREVSKHTMDFSEVRGQGYIKRAMEIAAAGGHNMLMIGPPGSGKTMLAKRLPTILPTLTLSESLEVTKIYSVAGKLPAQTTLVATRPFRAPHHTVSDVALVGGGSHPQPGEISLAHNGVLFLDELPEFKRSVLEVMRQPLEEGKVHIARARVSVDFPARFMLLAAMNPCPCGYYNHPEKECMCSGEAVRRYLNKISGPLLDRMDLHIEVVPVDFSTLSKKTEGETSALVRERVQKARALQKERFQGSTAITNAHMSVKQIDSCCAINEDSRKLLEKAIEKLSLSARSYHRILKVARTIADLDASSSIQTTHIAEAIQFRSLDRSKWGIQQ